MQLLLHKKNGSAILKLATLILITGIAFHIYAQDKPATCSVTFFLHSPDLADTSTVYICGSVKDLGYWDPSKTKMVFEGNHVWSKKIAVSNPSFVEYKYTLGSWDREGSDENGKPLKNFVVNISNDTLIKDNVQFWLQGSRKNERISHVTGKAEYHRQMKGDSILPRDFVVWLPPGYDVSAKQHYPVLYMQDGQNIFDPATSAFGVDWQIDETCDSLIKAKIIAPLIIVGIYNTTERTNDYTPGAGGDAYMRFVVNKVKPFIDSAYRSMPDRKHTLAGGSSAGGLISFMLAWEYPHIFSRAICMSPAFKVMQIDYVKNVSGYKGKKKPVLFYIDNGGVGLETKLQPGIDEMLKTLKEKGYREGKDYFWLPDPQAKHFESDWAKRFPAAIRWCLKS